ncbi:MAG: saccharopine dehydrogenase family protein, partial [Nevskiaceae bacterium]
DDRAAGSVRLKREAGVDYCDLTGEVQGIRRMIERYEAEAIRSGARIVHCCGFDSIPSDLGVHYLQQQSLQSFGEPCDKVNMRVRAMRGGFSGGTAASLINVAREVSANPALRKELANPYSLCQLGVAAEGLAPVRQAATRLFVRDAATGGWITPFIMAAINTRIVHRSNALSRGRYSRSFRYDEAVSTGRGLRGCLTAVGAGMGLSVFMLASAFGSTRTILERFVLPAPGEGPSPEAQLKGCFDLRFFGRTASGCAVRVKVTGDRDPGYGSTATMLGEAAMSLAFDVPRESVGGGFWTPATILGDRLVTRLEAHAGLRFERQE